MKLTSNILEKLTNSEYITNIYPMVDHIESEVTSEDDEYNIHLKIYLNDLSINYDNMYQKGFDPHYLVDYHLLYLMKLVGINTKDIFQINITVINPDGEIIYG